MKSRIGAICLQAAEGRWWWRQELLVRPCPHVGLWFCSDKEQRVSPHSTDCVIRVFIWNQRWNRTKEKITDAHKTSLVQVISAMFMILDCMRESMNVQGSTTGKSVTHTRASKYSGRISVLLLLSWGVQRQNSKYQSHHTCNPSFPEAEAGGLIEVWD